MIYSFNDPTRAVGKGGREGTKGERRVELGGNRTEEQT